MLSTEKLRYSIDKKVLLDQISTSFDPGRFHVIMGPNGAGKSTLLKVLAGEKKGSGGAVLWNGKDLFRLGKKELALRRAVLSQQYHLSFPVSVTDLVMMGRYPHFDNQPSSKDIEIVKGALEKMDMVAFASREYRTLSGGEQQKVQMSRVLAQIWEGGDKILFLDEPVSHLDIRFQHALLRAAKELTLSGTTVIAVLHDINLALHYADRLLLMKEGQMMYDLEHPAMVTAEMISDTFSVPAKVGDHDGRPYVFFF